MVLVALNESCITCGEQLLLHLRNRELGREDFLHDAGADVIPVLREVGFFPAHALGSDRVLHFGVLDLVLIRSALLGLKSGLGVVVGQPVVDEVTLVEVGQEVILAPEFGDPYTLLKILCIIMVQIKQ